MNRCVLLSALLAGPAAAAPWLDLHDITVTKPTALDLATVDGCAPGTYDYQVSSDARYLQIRFHDFAVSVAGAPQQRRVFSKVCHLNLDARLPDGWALAIDAAELRVHANVSDATAGGSVEANYGVDPYRSAVRLVART